MTDEKEESKLEASSRHEVTESTRLVPDIDSQSTYMQPEDIPAGKEDIEQLGAYRIERLLGKGGMGNVYLGFDEGLERYAAIKVIADHLASSEEAQQRLATEARAAARLNHPNIVQVYAYGEDKGKTFIAFEYIKGRDLDEIIKADGPLHLKRALEVTKQAAKGLRFGYSQNVIHRDIKPANLMVVENGSIKVADFGLAKELDKDHIKTRTDTIVGSPAYMSPEQGMGRTLDFRSDIYSLGATLYCCLTGRVPFRGESALSVLLMHANENLPEPPEITKHLQGAVMELVKKMMAKKLEERHQSYDELIQHIEELEKAFTTGKPVKAHLKPGDKLSSPLTPKQQKSNKVLIIAGGIGLLMTIIVVFTVMSGGDKRRSLSTSSASITPRPTPMVTQPPTNQIAASGTFESNDNSNASFENISSEIDDSTLEQTSFNRAQALQSLLSNLAETEKSLFGTLERSVPMTIRPQGTQGNVVISKMGPGIAEIILPDGTTQTGSPPRLPIPYKIEIAKNISELTPNISNQDRAKLDIYRFMLGDDRINTQQLIENVDAPQMKTIYSNWVSIASIARQRISQGGMNRQSNRNVPPARMGGRQ